MLFINILDSLMAPCLVHNTAMYTVYSQCGEYGRCMVHTSACAASAWSIRTLRIRVSLVLVKGWDKTSRRGVRGVMWGSQRVSTAFQLRFHVPLDTKQVISATFFPDNLLASSSTEDTVMGSRRYFQHGKHDSTMSSSSSNKGANSVIEQYRTTVYVQLCAMEEIKTVVVPIRKLNNST